MSNTPGEALEQHGFDSHERHLVIDDTDDDITQILCIIRECSPRTLEVLS
jgi:hypothetical protein